MEDICLESVWGDRLDSMGWSERAKKQYMLKWSPSTLASYNKVVKKLQVFCDGQCSFPPRESSQVADFLCGLADTSGRPRGILSTATAALSCLYEGLGRDNVTNEPVVRNLVMALIKSGTKAPRKVTPVMPIKPFHDLFLRWPDNDLLTIRDLRLKTLVLMALAFMLRPSDVAPRGMLFDPTVQDQRRMVFSTRQIEFGEDGGVTISFHGIKNDYLREGFTVSIPPASVPKIDPVEALRTYLMRTESVRPGLDLPVFLTLQRPFRALSSDSVARVLDDGIKAAGLVGYTAKSFRPTGATVAVNSGMDQDSARNIGRWRCREVFEEHYVHSKVSGSYTDKLLGCESVDKP